MAEAATADSTDHVGATDRDRRRIFIYVRSFPVETDEGRLPTLADFAAAQSVALTRFAYVLCGDHQRAEDLVQETFLAIHRRFGDLLPVTAPIAYARKTLVNAHLAASRRRSAGELPLAELPDVPAPSADPDLPQLLWQALAALPARQRAVLVMRYYLDLPDQAIADALDCRPGTVRSLASRALAGLRSQPIFVEESS